MSSTNLKILIVLILIVAAIHIVKGMTGTLPICEATCTEYYEKRQK